MRTLALLLPVLLLAACSDPEPPAPPPGPAPLPAHPVGEVSKGELPPVHAPGDQASKDCGQNSGCRTN